MLFSIKEDVNKNCGGTGLPFPRTPNFASNNLSFNILLLTRFFKDLKGEFRSQGQLAKVPRVKKYPGCSTDYM